MLFPIALTKTKIIVNRVNSNTCPLLIELIEFIFENQRKLMENTRAPYLCGGTFLTQILRARKELSTSTGHTKGQKESLSEQETFRRLISIYQLTNFHGGTSLKTYTSKYKKCTDSLVAYGQFSDNDLHRAFDEDVKSSNSTALSMMAEFVQEFINPASYVQLVRCLLDIIENETGTSIKYDDKFFISTDAIAIKAKDLCDVNHFYIESFLLGVWHYIIMNRVDDNTKGAATYEQWYPSRGDYRGTVGNGITRVITIDNIPAVPFDDVDSKSGEPFNADPQVDFADSNDESESKSDNFTQHIEHATIVNQNGEKNIHIDHVDVLNL